jgi:hypothetical protein
METRDQVIAEYAAGRSPAEIGASHGLTEAEVERIVSAETGARKPRGPGLSSTGNRVLLSVAIGWVVWFFAHQFGAPTVPGYTLLIVVAAVAYAITTAMVRR